MLAQAYDPQGSIAKNFYLLRTRGKYDFTIDYSAYVCYNYKIKRYSSRLIHYEYQVISKKPCA